MFNYRKAPNANAVQLRIHRNQDAVFLGWQETKEGAIFPLYNIVKEDHPSYRSTVSIETLLRMQLRIPRTPSPFQETGPAPWHNLGTELIELTTSREVMEAAGLNYTVVKKPLREVLEIENPESTFDLWATVRTDNGEVLGIVDENYEVIQNIDVFKFFDTLVSSNKAVYETAGMFGRGERIWILAKLPGYINVHGKDIVSKYLLLSNSHDDKSSVQIRLTPIRVVCNNTLTAALKGTGNLIIHDNTHATEDIQNALSVTGQSTILWDRLETLFNRMAVTKISDMQLLEYVKALVPDEEDHRHNAENRQVRETILELYESGQGADLSRGTLWGAFNCATEYTDHDKTGDAIVRLESNWFGKGEQFKLKAFQLAEHMI